MNFAEKKLPMRFACLVSMPTPLPATSNSVSSRGFFEHVGSSAGLLFIVYGKMSILAMLLDNYSTLFDRTVTTASRVSADKCQVSLYRVITYHIVTILSCLCYNLNGYNVIEYYKHFVDTIIKRPQ